MGRRGVSTRAFSYTAVDRAGATTVGRAEGESPGAVAARLRARGLTVIDVQAKRPGLDLRELNERMERVKARQVVVLARQLAAMISSGLTLLRAFQVLEDQAPGKKLHRAISEVRQDIEAGVALSQAMSRHPEVFSDLFISMVRAGEIGGNLDEVLNRVADALERQDELRRTVRSAMAYPSLIAGFAGLVLIGMVMFLIPVFEEMYADLDAELPALTQMMVGASRAMRSQWYLVLLTPPLAVWGLKRWRATERGGLAWDALKLRLPLGIGDVVRKIAVARVSRTLATLTASGVPILQALEITGRTAGNRVISDPMAEVIARVREGQPLARPLAQAGVFPPMVTQMVEVGEQAGSLDAMLHKVADFYDAEVATTLRALTSILEPVLMILVGAIVGLVVIALYLPMFQLFNEVG
jgi:type IV pilus assembly protein PilC